MDEQERRRRGETIRREVLGDAHVDRSLAGRTDFNGDFLDLITRYAWGEIWERPGLARRERSLITIAMLAALGREAELKLHLGAARNNGVSRDELKETLLQVAVYGGVPAANTAFQLAEEALAATSCDGGDGSDA
ncbi:4-carboxymuconolactone decarboxylase [Chromobacterium alkanivorans]|uniref:4-carboxymuconolactone decarboxylase n=1 Tax=Chromobacterium alkanivorans TaxID=1071719 RepID=UPI002168A63F|nr:4-carboxymuconolactone decarboxylase [Chromobacterium alkanivorans]MCS3806002.1 4-carboxymuconolactone decarboxylase [Chromobacterium alkanivorans]MCS3820340.1 4-carboxymuconolactone decarboxylase [Chromobacterium alkanivorans]MCS3875098.1 4-carboxymuconolactone decarboxylase [Chromobacterium alkanivorans]